MTTSNSLPHSSDIALPTTLMALDWTAALDRLGNNTQLYLQVARDYRAELIGLPTRAQELLQNDLKTALRMLHSFRGVSLTLGANQVGDVCRQCEQALAALQAQSQALAGDTCKHMLAVLQQVTDATLLVLDQTLDALSSKLGKAAAPSTRPLPLATQRSMVPQLRTIQTLLSRSDMQALDMYDALCASHAGLEHSWPALDASIKAFDFRNAAAECGALLQRLGAS